MCKEVLLEVGSVCGGTGVRLHQGNSLPKVCTQLFGCWWSNLPSLSDSINHGSPSVDAQQT